MKNIKDYEREIKTILNNDGLDGVIYSYEDFCMHFSCRPNDTEFPKYKTGDIIDEDMSVKWNREEVERRINARDEEVKRLNTLKNQVTNYYEEVIIKDLAETYKISVEESKLLWGYAYREGHSSGVRSVLNYYYEVVDLYGDLLKARK